MTLDLNQLCELLAAIAQNDIAELTLKSDDFELSVRKGSSTSESINTTVGNTGTVEASELLETPSVLAISTASIPTPESKPTVVTTEPSVAPPTADPKWEEVLSPMVGTYYYAPAPDEAPFVEVGDQVRIGQTLCIIEAMKLMNEIEAELSGQVVEILVNNGEPVEYGQPLMRINPG
ncbi:MAG: acetyl-CoA carboxylase biotin carboxyl carrier protein [Symploca sp. SIO2G7]|nr:acetyl-CoA carboxylase biotin carboxyl carrier protein [Symploca sp. SIO2G7]